MQNKVTVTIADREYTLVATEDAAYMEKVAKYVDQKMREIMENGISGTDAAVLAALMMADDCFKGQEAGEALRGQIRGYQEEVKALEDQLSEAKREIFKLQTQGKK